MLKNILTKNAQRPDSFIGESSQTFKSLVIPNIHKLLQKTNKTEYFPAYFVKLTYITVKSEGDNVRKL